MKVDVKLAWALTAASALWAVLERKLRQETIRRMSGRVAEFEQRLDAKRSSSKLSPDGGTHPRDELR
jgi:hypothetical protein